MPLPLVARLPRPEVDADRAELRGVRRLRRAAEHVRTPGDLEVHESRGDDRRLELCFQQSAGDSTRPQIDVTQSAVRERLADDNVGDLDTAARLEHTGDFGHGAFFLGDEVEHAIGDDDVDALIVHRQVRRVSLPDVDMSQSGHRGALQRPSAHCLGHVDPDGPAGGPGPLRGEQQIHSSATADVKNGRSDGNATDRMRIADAGERGGHVGGERGEFRRVVSEHRGRVVRTSMKMEIALRLRRHARIHRPHLVAKACHVEINRTGHSHETSTFARQLQIIGPSLVQPPVPQT